LMNGDFCASLGSRLMESLMISPVVKAKPNTKGQFLRASDNATCVKGLPTTGVTIPSCWSQPFALAPVTNYFVSDT
jgi:hypothetical protein